MFSSKTCFGTRRNALKSAINMLYGGITLFFGWTSTHLNYSTLYFVIHNNKMHSRIFLFSLFIWHRWKSLSGFFRWISSVIHNIEWRSFPPYLNDPHWCFNHDQRYTWTYITQICKSESRGVIWCQDMISSLTCLFYFNITYWWSFSNKKMITSG